jgi:RNA polymerase sigma factor (sigma-70 family)
VTTMALLHGGATGCAADRRHTDRRGPEARTGLDDTLDRRRTERRAPSDRPFLAALAAGDADTWATAVARYSGLLYATTRRYSLPAAEADDVVQQTWLKLFEHAGTIRDPGALPGWLATTTRRECLARRQAHWREAPLTGREDPPDPTPDPLHAVLEQEASTSLRAAIDRLPDRERSLLQLLLSSPAPSYTEISERLDIPVGSIGPVRGRALRKLRCLLAAPVARTA